MNKYYNDYDGIIRDDIKAAKWIIDDGDMDYRIYLREFSGRMTKQRYKAIADYCRRNSYSLRCGCEHDCCGHMTGQDISFTYSRNQVSLRLSIGYNY